MPQIKASDNWLEKEREIKGIRQDIAAARQIIADGLLRYKKKMLHAKSKKETEDLSVFAELEDYHSKQEIHDAFGWGDITDSKMHRLNDLWDAREQFINEQGRFENRVTQILERAMGGCGDMFADALAEFDDLQRADKQVRHSIETENAVNTNARYQAGLKKEGV